MFQGRRASLGTGTAGAIGRNQALTPLAMTLSALTARLSSWPPITGAIVGLAVLGCAQIALRLQPPDIKLGFFWPATGVLLAALLLTGGRHRIAALVGAACAYVISNIINDRPFSNTVFFTLINLAEVLGIAYLVESTSRPFHLTSLRAVGIFALSCIFVIACTGLAVAVYLTSLGHATAPFLDVWRTWFFSDLTGALTVCPWFIALAARSEHMGAARTVENFFNAAIATVTAYFLVGQTDVSPNGLILTVVILYPLIVWVTARGDLASGALVLMAIALTVVWHTSNSQGLFAGDGLAAQAFLLTMAFSVLTLGATMRENRLALQDSRRTAALLTDSERRTRLALQSASAGLHTWHMKSDEFDWDESVRAHWGLPPDVPSSRQVFLDAIHPDDRVKALQAMHKALDPSGNGDYAAEYRVCGADGKLRWIAATGKVEFEDGHPARLIGTSRDISERMAREQHIRLLMREISHRSKNLLTVVLSIARQTSPRATSVGEFEKIFSARVQSLSKCQDLLVAQDWRGVPLVDLIKSQIGHYAELSQSPVSIDACGVMLTPAAAQSIGMAIHELSTNAAKYGALTATAGRVAISCKISGGPGREDLVISWDESGGPTVVEPPSTGFGTLVIKRLLMNSLDGEVDVAFPETGLRWRFVVPLANVDGQPALALS